MAMFQIGDDVICVLGGRLADSSPRLNQFPVKNQTYKIRGIQQTPYKHLTNQCGLLLEEIINDYNPHTNLEWDYFSRRFRKVQKKDQKTSIEVFEKLLDPKNLPAPTKEREKVREPEKVE